MESSFRSPWLAAAAGLILCGLCASSTAADPRETQASGSLSLEVVPDTRKTATYQRIKAHLDSIPAIDTHDHLEFDTVPGLYTLWRESYFGVHVPPIGHKYQHIPVKQWWPLTEKAFADGRNTCFYKYQHIAFQDLYGVDFDQLTEAQAERLDAAVRARYQDPAWIAEIVTKRANVEVVVIDYDYTPYDYVSPHPFGVSVVRLNPLVRGFHPDEYDNEPESPWHYAKVHGLPLKSLDDYLAVLDHIMRRAADRGAVGMKSTLAYTRTLRFEQVSREDAAKVFGRRRSELRAEQIRAFEDFVFWQFCTLSTRYDLPLQIHTGLAFDRSNPVHLENLIQAHPETRFMVFHGGFPWIGETSMLAMRFSKNVWIDSNWLPTVSYSVAKRAFHEWLDIIPSNRILWGSDTLHAEGLYGATAMTRRCLAEVLAERVDRSDMTEAEARIVGRKILRENALEAFPRLRSRVASDAAAALPGE